MCYKRFNTAMLLYRSLSGTMKKDKIGFTLIELLVVIAILGILATVGLGSFQSSLMKGRDAQRKHDLGQIQKALEMYLNDHGRYIAGLPAAAAPLLDPDNNQTIYMKSVPQGPKGDDYCYETDATGTYYRIYAKLENVNDQGIIKSGCVAGGLCSCADAGGCACNINNNNYRVWSSNAP